MGQEDGCRRRLRSEPRSDYDRLTEAGGPIRLVEVPTAHEPHLKELLREASSEIPFDAVEKALIPFNVGWSSARLHWPWIAFAARTFRHYRDRAKSSQNLQLKPSQMKGSLRRIATLSQQLHDEIIAFKASGALVGKPLLTGHVSMLSEILVLGGAGFFDEQEFSRDPREHHRDFLATLARLPEAAKFAESRMNADTVRKKGGGGDPALPQLVEIAKLIWPSMTGRPSSVNRISSKSRLSDVPDFIFFVQAIARLSLGIPHCSDPDIPHPETGAIPTPSQIATAFRSRTSG